MFYDKQNWYFVCWLMYSEMYNDDGGSSFEMLEITRRTNRCLTAEDHIMNMKL